MDTVQSLARFLCVAISLGRHGDAGCFVSRCVQLCRLAKMCGGEAHWHSRRDWFPRTSCTVARRRTGEAAVALLSFSLPSCICVPVVLYIHPGKCLVRDCSTPSSTLLSLLFSSCLSVCMSFSFPSRVECGRIG